MLLRAEFALAGFPFLARRLGLTLPADETAVRAALNHAATLAASADDDPAAVFFAFASFRRAFPGAWREMAGLLAYGQARANGLYLDASGQELDALCTEVMYRRTDFEAVRAWFAPRLQPDAPP